MDQPTIKLLEVRRDNVRETRFADEPLPRLDVGQALLRIDQFGLTSNNVTYGATGNSFGYWGFFPSSDGWGRIPVWGFAEVIESRAQGVEPGTRLFGYLPMATHLVVEPTRLTPGGFFDAAQHRASLPGVYNRYRRIENDPMYTAGSESFMTIFFPLFITSFVLDDFLADNGDFGAEQIVISSASSKTSAGAALCIARRAGTRPRIVGLTSPSHVGFVTSMGLYDEVRAYSDVEGIAVRPTVYVDVSGDRGLRVRVHKHFGEDLKHSSAVGLAHWDAAPNTEPVPGPPSTLFFAPNQIDKRLDDWGAAGYQRRLSAAWSALGAVAGDWSTFVQLDGLEAALPAYQSLLDGSANPREAFVVAP